MSRRGLGREAAKGSLVRPPRRPRGPGPPIVGCTSEHRPRSPRRGRPGPRPGPERLRPRHRTQRGGRGRLVAHQLRSFGWTPEIDPVAPGRPNVYAFVDGGRPGPTLMFEGHTDVVTEGDRDAWSVDAFRGEIRDGRLYGRGSADMKSGLVASMFAARAVADEAPFPGRILLAALVD